MNKKLILSGLIVASGSLLASNSQPITPRLFTPRSVNQPITPPKILVHETPSKHSVVSSDTNGTVCEKFFDLFLVVQKGTRELRLPYEDPKATIENVLHTNGINCNEYHLLTPKTRKHVFPHIKAQSIQGLLLKKKPANPFDVSDTDSNKSDSQSDSEYGARL